MLRLYLFKSAVEPLRLNRIAALRFVRWITLSLVLSLVNLSTVCEFILWPAFVLPFSRSSY